MVFELEKLKSIQTDFAKDGAFQKCVHFSNDKSVLVTGGADGFMRVWKVSYAQAHGLAFIKALKSIVFFVCNLSILS